MESLIIKASRKPIIVLSAIFIGIITMRGLLYYMEPDIKNIYIILGTCVVWALLSVIILKNTIMVTDESITLNNIFIRRVIQYHEIISVKIDNGIVLLKINKNNKIIKFSIILIVYQMKDIHKLVERLNKYCSHKD